MGLSMSRPDEPILIHAVRTEFVKGKAVITRFSYMASKATLADEQLIAWANRRDE